jgi:hypothetical protein
VGRVGFDRELLCGLSRRNPSGIAATRRQLRVIEETVSHCKTVELNLSCLSGWMRCPKAATVILRLLATSFVTGGPVLG